MTLWVVRAGRHGENESFALERGCVVIGWDELGDVSGLDDRAALHERMRETHPDVAETTAVIWTGEVWAFARRMRTGDLVCLPLKTRSALAFGEVTGAYRWDSEAPEGARHQRAVRWIRTDLPRGDVDQDLLYSLSGSLAVFQVKRNEAEKRLRALLAGERLRPPAFPGRRSRVAVDEEPAGESQDGADETAAPADLEQFARDQIVEHIGRHFRGHTLSHLIGGILSAQGYKIFLSPPGADGGVDILAGRGPMGFDPPRLAVQVKSSDSPADVSVLRELQGVMPRFGAEQGLIVSWGGYRGSVMQEARQLFFQVQLWDAGDVVAALQTHYEALPDDLQAAIPLKRLWALVVDS